MPYLAAGERADPNCREEEPKYIVRTLISNLRVGANWRSVMPGLARAFLLHERGPRVTKAEMDAASAQVSEAFHLCPNLDVLVPALQAGGLAELERCCTLKAGTRSSPPGTPTHAAVLGLELMHLCQLIRSTTFGTRIWLVRSHRHCAEALTKPGWLRSLVETLCVKGIGRCPFSVHTFTWLWGTQPACRAAGVPLKPMLAKICEGIPDALSQLRGEFLAEFKYDGQRSQIHMLPNGSVKLFSRNCEAPWTPSFCPFRLLQSTATTSLTRSLRVGVCFLIQARTRQQPSQTWWRLCSRLPRVSCCCQLALSQPPRKAGHCAAGSPAHRQTCWLCGCRRGKGAGHGHGARGCRPDRGQPAASLPGAVHPRAWPDRAASGAQSLRCPVLGVRAGCALPDDALPVCDRLESHLRQAGICGTQVSVQVCVFVFDILMVDGDVLIKQTLRERRARIALALPNMRPGYIQLVQSLQLPAPPVHPKAAAGQKATGDDIVSACCQSRNPGSQTVWQLCNGRHIEVILLSRSCHSGGCLWT